MITALYIGNKKLDLFEDDNIVIKNSVSKIEDITKVFTETSNSFSVPATDNNNSVFKHYYNASINNPFDGRKLVLGAIYLDGLHYKTGNFKLNKVILKSKKANSYSIDFFGLLTQLKELTGKDKLSDLDLSDDNYNYNYTNVKNRLTNQNLSNTNILNTLLSSKRYIYDTNTNTENTDELRNLANNNTENTSGLVFEDTHSSLKNIRIIEAIENKYNLTFSRDFFGNNDFNSLYLLLNGGEGVSLLSEEIVFNSSNDATLENNEILLSTDLAFDDTQSIKVLFSVQQVGSAVFSSQMTSEIRSNGVLIHEFKDELHTANIARDAKLSTNYTILKSNFTDFENLTFRLKSSIPVSYSYEVTRTNTSNEEKVSTKNNSLIQSFFSVADSFPNITILDYLKGIFQMFKLIVIPTSDTNLFVDSYENYYNTGVNRDVTKFIDFSEISINSGNFINEINYKFEESQTLLAKQFKTLTEKDYGNLELKILDNNGKLIEGEAISIELPFENMVYEKLPDLNSQNNAEIVYGLLQDENQDAVIIKPHLHYISIDDLNNDIKIINESGNVELISNFCSPIHLKSQNTTTFGAEINEHTGSIMTTTLYNNFHKTFIESSFNIKKRLYNFKVKNADLDLITKLKLNDNIIINGGAYRIDSYDTNLTTREIDFNLINIT